MKIRNGFVSNSSSSSFVVAFPSKPKDTTEVCKFMFNGQEGVITFYDNEVLSYSRVASLVFEDIKDKKCNGSCANNDSGACKKVTLENLVELFSTRYHYYPEGNNVFWAGRITDDHGGSWTEPVGRYYGSNKKLMNELRELTVANKKAEEKIWEKERIIMKNAPKAPKTPYAYKGGKDSKTKKPYTKKEIKSWEDYHNALENFKKNSGEWRDLMKERDTFRNNYWKTSRELQDKIAQEDAQNFLDDNKGKFIFIVEYSDNDSAQGSSMEHGDIFRNVPHIRISHH